MKWMVPKAKLSDNQVEIASEIVRTDDESHWITGYAGSGKTVVITHAINEIASRSPGDTIGFLTYTHALKDMVTSGLSAKVKKSVEVLTLDAFFHRPKYFDHLFVDEIQDAEPRHLPKILGASPHLVVAGDPDQSIYTNRYSYGDLSKALGSPNKHVLPEVFRLSKNSLQISKSIYPEAKLVSGAKLRRSDSLPATLLYENEEDDEINQVWESARSVAEPELPSAILLPQHKLIHKFAQIIARENGLGELPVPTKLNGQVGQGFDYKEFNQFFEKKKFPLMFLGSSYGSFPASDRKELVYLLTYHSAKGLDFQNTFIPLLTEKTRIKENYEDDSLGRRKFLVAVTRARYQQNLSYHDEMHTYLSRIPNNLFD